ncbi:MAG: PLP-dependent aminotransferase family protein [Firmicutes bacterium]|nr:PLP-dependent aminotransferase family protein [Bacillota bacterium]
MKQILPLLDRTLSTPLYEQLYKYLKSAVRSGELRDGEKLPSLRSLASSLSISITTVEQAYAQLMVEGYVRSRPQSGYYISSGPFPDEDTAPAVSRRSDQETAGADTAAPDTNTSEPAYTYDLACFDFAKWKKCYNSVLNDQPQQLLFEADPRGEDALRREISRYVFASRGVRCSKDRIVIAAGTQQITSLIASLLQRRGISNVAVEQPGYLPVRSIFRDRGFRVTPVGVTEDGIRIEKLPANLPSAVYVNPSNQFPTGAIMPASRRYALLRWAAENDSYIIEDDYDSELRYFGRPIPALQGLDEGDRVFYLGSFSSTLFPAARISYMVVPQHLSSLLETTLREHSQSCSKAEQLALALFMERGYYRKGINRLRRMYAAKLNAAIRMLSEQPGIDLLNTWSGISLLLRVHPATPVTKDNKKALAALLSEQAATAGMEAVPVEESDEMTGGGILMALYYTRIPLREIEQTLRRMLDAWGL